MVEAVQFHDIRPTTQNLMNRLRLLRFPHRYLSLRGINSDNRPGLFRSVISKNQQLILPGTEDSESHSLPLDDFVSQAATKYLDHFNSSTTPFASLENAKRYATEVLPVLNRGGDRVTTLTLELSNNKSMPYSPHLVVLVTDKGVYSTYFKTSEPHSVFEPYGKATVSLPEKAMDESIRYAVILEADNTDQHYDPSYPHDNLNQKSQFGLNEEFKFLSINFYKFLESEGPENYALHKKLADLLYQEGKMTNVQRLISLLQARISYLMKSTPRNK